MRLTSQYVFYLAFWVQRNWNVGFEFYDRFIFSGLRFLTTWALIVVVYLHVTMQRIVNCPAVLPNRGSY